MSISLVAGLGNPGLEYEGTRHNVGAVVVEALALQLGLPWQKERSFKAQIARWNVTSDQTILLAKPLTYMNESGLSVQAITGYYKIPAVAVVAVYDDLTIDLPRLKVSISGSAGGHNGVASLINSLGTGFTRYRIGIGPKSPPQMDLKDFVLGKFTSEQQSIITQSLDHYTAGLRLLLNEGADRAMNQLNRRDTQ